MSRTTLTSHSGLVLPAIGFGTYKLNGSAGVQALHAAIDNGYTLLDSAFNYENEGTVGHAVRTSGHDRGDIIVTSKLPGRHHRHDEALRTVEESVYRTGLDAIDLYLIHWPNPKVGLYVEAWQALIEARERGLLTAIGVCNFLPEHLERLEAETGVLPDVNQIELHPYFPQAEALTYDAEHGIITEAWSPLGRGNDVLSQPVIAEIAAAHDATAAQVVLAWHMGRGALPLPKAATPSRQVENLAATELVLTSAEIDAVTALGRPDGRLADQDPAVYEEF
ncbi:aldo/keto reductase [Acidipropionibacterium virtanenii]|uniref:2,5-diketo-D-gluconic acid reductase B n=1 Tax=Acidipropionibacterium virtanenii TaxID=2057246 RepID=A0A344UUC7_9ACTN|nr:aldo/keto reductase [Acidipropionibacterium virtanenii]AXE38875.1 2,5-diketo-D-gluconic acid reductase B [Acidipropionibacterium virtanenii]